MEALSVRDYRKNLAASFDRAEKGERVLIRRKNNLYALISIGKEEVDISPELSRRLDEAREEYAKGNFTSCNDKQELHDFLESL